MTEPQKPPTLWQTIASVGAAFFGVQSSKNRERDFKHGKAAHFIVIGLVATVVFVLAVWLAVRFALSQAGR
ncbi:MAG: DUF2970 domain-containing protein [Gammaproteobacteria bacterium]